MSQAGGGGQDGPAAPGTSPPRSPSPVAHPSGRERGRAVRHSPAPRLDTAEPPGYVPGHASPETGPNAHLSAPGGDRVSLPEMADPRAVALRLRLEGRLPSRQRCRRPGQLRAGGTLEPLRLHRPAGRVGGAPPAKGGCGQRTGAAEPLPPERDPGDPAGGVCGLIRAYPAARKADPSDE